jgi:hypothetical protein
MWVGHRWIDHQVPGQVTTENNANCPTDVVVHGTTKWCLPGGRGNRGWRERERYCCLPAWCPSRPAIIPLSAEQSRAVAARGNARACGKCGREEGTGSRSRKQKSLALTASVSPPWREARRGETTHLSFAASRCVALRKKVQSGRRRRFPLLRYGDE